MDLLNQFQVFAILPIKLFGLDISLTNSALFMLFVFLFSSVVLLTSVSRYVTPSYMQSFNEMFYNFIDGLVDQYVGKDAKQYTPFFMTLFLFVVLGNLFGLLPHSFTFTSHLITTFVLAMFVFVLSIVVGFSKHGMRFFKIFSPSGVPTAMIPLIFFIELALFFVKPVVMALRLCVNMIAGHIMLKVVFKYSLSLGLLKFFPIFGYSALLLFEFGVAIFQAYIFVLLSCISLKGVLYLH